LMIAFLLLPIAAATIGALQSEKSLQASTRSLHGRPDQVIREGGLPRYPLPNRHWGGKRTLS